MLCFQFNAVDNILVTIRPECVVSVTIKPIQRQPRPLIELCRSNETHVGVGQFPVYV